MLVKTFAAALQGISATIITIEVNCTKGISNSFWLDCRMWQ